MQSVMKRFSLHHIVMLLAGIPFLLALIMAV